MGKRTDGQGWCIAGGKVDEDEGIEEAARRELFEEFGIVALSLICEGVIESAAIVNGKFREVKSYIYSTDKYIIPPNAITPNFEFSEFAWMALTEIKLRDDIFRPTRESVKLL